MDLTKPLKVLVFVNTNPHLSPDSPCFTIDEVQSEIEISAYIVPYEMMRNGDVRWFRGKPIVTWENPDPFSVSALDMQYWTLSRLTEVDHSVYYQWKDGIFQPPGRQVQSLEVPLRVRGDTKTLSEYISVWAREQKIKIRTQKASQ